MALCNNFWARSLVPGHYSLSELLAVFSVPRSVPGALEWEAGHQVVEPSGIPSLTSASLGKGRRDLLLLLCRVGTGSEPCPDSATQCLLL